MMGTVLQEGLPLAGLINRLAITRVHYILVSAEAPETERNQN